MEIHCTAILCDLVFNTCDKWLDHMKYHINDEVFLCCFCLKEFSKLWRLNRHTKSCDKREEVTTVSEERNAWNNSASQVEDVVDLDNTLLHEIEWNEFRVSFDRLPCDARDRITLKQIEEHIFNFMLKLYGKMSLPKSVAIETLLDVNNKLIVPLVNLIIQSLDNMEFLEGLQLSLEKFMRKHGTNHNFQEMCKVRNLYFDPMYFKIALPRSIATKKRKYSHGYVLPIANNIKSYFDENIRELSAMLKLHKQLMSRDNGIIESEVQCNVWREKMLNFEGLEVVPIRLYQDDFEVNNPIGSKSGCQKISGSYISFPLMGELIFF